MAKQGRNLVRKRESPKTESKKTTAKTTSRTQAKRPPKNTNTSKKASPKSSTKKATKTTKAKSAKFVDKKTSPLDKISRLTKYGTRHNSTQPKGEGWLGNIGTKSRPVTEYTIGHKGAEIPTAVPTLTSEEARGLGLDATFNRMPSRAVIKKARQWADRRWSQGKSQFKD